MEPGVLRQTLGISRFIGDEDVFLEVTNSVRILRRLYLERQSDTNLSTCFVHGEYVFFANFMQIRLR